MKENLKKSNQSKKISQIAKIIIIFAIILSSVSYAFAATLTDLQKKQAEINQSIKDATNKVNEKKQEIKEVTEQIANLDKDIAEIEAKIADTQNKLNNLNKEIKNIENQIAQKQEELNREYENQREAIRVMYESGYADVLKIIIGSNTLSELIDHSHYLETIENKIETTIEEINRLKSELETQKKELETKKNEMTKLQEQQQAYKYGLDQSKAQKNRVLADAQSEKKSLEAQISEAKKLSAQVEGQINSILASMNKNDGRTVTARDKGTSAVGFMWPMDYKYISCYYGEQTPFQSFHSGIDLVNIPGTPVYAAADGTVTVVSDMMRGGSYYGYGKYIVVGHNARYSSLYGHLMGFAVSVGAEVKKGDIIGYEGNTGWSTGPHLHFEIWDNGARVNPLNYLP